MGRGQESCHHWLHGLLMVQVSIVIVNSSGGICGQWDMALGWFCHMEEWLSKQINSWQGSFHGCMRALGIAGLNVSNMVFVAGMNVVCGVDCLQASLVECGSCIV